MIRTSALPPEADIKLELVQRSANDPKQTHVLLYSNNNEQRIRGKFMNSEKINQRLTLAANVGVLIGVIFLALEVRHASDMAQAQMADSAVAGHNELNLALVSDPQVARVFVVGLYEPSNLSDAEAVQFAAWMRAYVNQNLRLRRMNQLGFKSAEEGNDELRQLARMLSTPGGALFLESNRDVFPEYLLQEIQPFLGQVSKDDFILGRKTLPIE